MTMLVEKCLFFLSLVYHRGLEDWNTIDIIKVWTCIEDENIHQLDPCGHGAAPNTDPTS